MSTVINEYETNARVGESSNLREISLQKKMNQFQENEKKLEEVQLINKNLEDILQKKSNEFNQKLTSVQQELHEVEQKHQVTNYSPYKIQEKNTTFVFLSSIKDSLALINQLKTVSSTNDAKLIESNGIITDLKHTNEVFNAAS